MKIEKTARREKIHDIEREIKHLHALAREAKEAGLSLDLKVSKPASKSKRKFDGCVTYGRKAHS